MYFFSCILGFFILEIKLNIISQVPKPRKRLMLRGACPPFQAGSHLRYSFTQLQ